MSILAPGESKDDLVTLTLTVAEGDVPMGERSWLTAVTFMAKPLGGDLFEIRSAPLLRLAWGDVVRANRKHEIEEAVSRSGHRTLLAVFDDDDLVSSLDAVRACGARPEESIGSVATIDVPPAVSSERVVAALGTSIRAEFTDESAGLLPDAVERAFGSLGRAGRARVNVLAYARAFAPGILIVAVFFILVELAGDVWAFSAMGALFAFFAIRARRRGRPRSV